MAACDTLQEVRQLQQELFDVDRFRRVGDAHVWCISIDRVFALTARLLELGPPSLLDARDEYGETALSYASGHEPRVDVICHLIDMGADPCLLYRDDDDPPEFLGVTLDYRLSEGLYEYGGYESLQDQYATAWAYMFAARGAREVREAVLAQIHCAGEWRPDGAGAYPSCWRGALRTLLLLARG